VSRPTRKQITEADEYQRQRYANFRRAAEIVARALAAFPEVDAIALIGSVARPLWREVPRFQPYRRLDLEILHECKDVDLAVWITQLSNLGALNHARNKAAMGFRGELGSGVANHQVDIFLLEPGTDRYLGRLCCFSQCPKGKRECLVEGCGRKPFLKQHEDFVFRPDATAEDRIIRLFDRRHGWLGSSDTDLAVSSAIVGET
jgi:hypothetical protein